MAATTDTLNQVGSDASTITVDISADNAITVGINIANMKPVLS